MNWEKIKKLNVRIEVPAKIKWLLFLVIGTWLCTSVCNEVLDYVSLKVYRVGKLLAPIIAGIPAIIVFKKEGRSFKSLFKGNYLKQILWGLAIGLCMLVCLFLIKGGIKWSIATSLFKKLDWYKVYITVYYLFIIGFAEEFIYRVVVQDYIDSLIIKAKFVSPLLTAVVFGIAHYWAGGWMAVLSTFLTGMLWGYMKYYIKNVTYLSVSLAHGLYDYGILVIPFIMSYM